MKRLGIGAYTMPIDPYSQGPVQKVLEKIRLRLSSLSVANDNVEMEIQEDRIHDRFVAHLDIWSHGRMVEKEDKREHEFPVLSLRNLIRRWIGRPMQMETFRYTSHTHHYYCCPHKHVEPGDAAHLHWVTTVEPQQCGEKISAAIRIADTLKIDMLLRPGFDPERLRDVIRAVRDYECTDI